MYLGTYGPRVCGHLGMYMLRYIAPACEVPTKGRYRAGDTPLPEYLRTWPRTVTGIFLIRKQNGESPMTSASKVGWPLRYIHICTYSSTMLPSSAWLCTVVHIVSIGPGPWTLSLRVLCSTDQ